MWGGDMSGPDWTPEETGVINREGEQMGQEQQNSREGNGGSDNSRATYHGVTDDHMSDTELARHRQHVERSYGMNSHREQQPEQQQYQPQRGVGLGTDIAGAPGADALRAVGLHHSQQPFHGTGLTSTTLQMQMHGQQQRQQWQSAHQEWQQQQQQELQYRQQLQL